MPCQCKNVQYYYGASYCHLCGGVTTHIVDLLNQTRFSEYCNRCDIKSPQSSKFCIFCGDPIKSKSPIETKIEDSYTLIAEALMRSSGVSQLEFKALCNLLRERFPKGDCQLIAKDLTYNIIPATAIGFQVSGQDVVTGTSAVALLAIHYRK